jgi:hypothetical protein
VSANTFTDEQIEAIRRRGAAFALAANAGSGKTSVLVERFVRDVTEDAITPSRILAITFTERAAGELRTRIRRGLLARGEHDAAHDSGAERFISTFHAFCARILRAHPLLTGLAPGFVVLADTETVALRERAFSLAFADWLERDGALDLAAAFDVEPLRTSIFEVFDEQRSRGELHHTCRRRCRAATQTLPAQGSQRPRGAIAAELAAATPIATVERALATLERCGELLDRGAEPGPAAARRCQAVGLRRPPSTRPLARPTSRRGRLRGGLADELGAAAVPLLDELLGASASVSRRSSEPAARPTSTTSSWPRSALLRDHEDVARSGASASSG